jgi:hypothetical protein
MYHMIGQRHSHSGHKRARRQVQMNGVSPCRKVLRGRREQTIPDHLSHITHFQDNEPEQTSLQQHRQTNSITTAASTRALLGELLILFLFLANTVLLAGAMTHPRPGSPLAHAGIALFGAAFGAGFAVFVLFLACELLVFLVARRKLHEQPAQPKV